MFRQIQQRKLSCKLFSRKRALASAATEVNLTDSLPYNVSALPIEFEDKYDQRSAIVSPHPDMPTTYHGGLPSSSLSIEMPVPWTGQSFQSETRDTMMVVLADLAPVARHIHEGPPELSKRDRALDRQDAKADDFRNSGQRPGAVDVQESVEALKTGISTFMDDIHWLMRILNEVARIHPFVAAPILAFKAVHGIQRTRRENDKRIIALYVAMKDMIAVLVQLKDIHEPTHIGPDGRTIEARMQSLAIRAANDIKACANACDTYSKKLLVVKVLKGVIWEGKLAEFFGRFERCRADFELALAIHTARVTDTIKSTVEAVDEKIAALTDTIRVMFRDMKPREEQFIEAKINEKGGAELVLEDDDALRELLEFENTIEFTRHKTVARADGCTQLSRELPAFDQDAKLRLDRCERTTQHDALFLMDIKKDLREDWTSAVDRNMLVFEGKFTVHQQQLRENLLSVIDEGNNRIIRKLSAGPHDRIRDKGLKEIWREMGGKRNVEANLFAITIRDHFREKAQYEVHGPKEVANRSTGVDNWTCEYMNISHLQRLKEAFDEDGSGYVTIHGVNNFLDAKPSDLRWSLQHWIAYWTIGWQISATKYRDEIRLLFAQMFALRKHILPTNKAVVEQYLDKIWLPAVRIIESLAPASSIPNHVAERFKAYTSTEEHRLVEKLQVIGYNIDVTETVHMITGQGKIEKHVLALIYLLLKQHLQSFHAAMQRQLGRTDDTFLTAANSLQNVYNVLSDRYLELVELFKHKGKYAEHMLRTFCCELFEYHYEPSLLWRSMHLQIELDDERIQDSDYDVCPLDRSRDVPAAISSPYEMPPESPTHADTIAEPHVKALLGEWNGFVYSPDEYPIFLMTSFYAHAAMNAGYDIQADGFHYGSSYTLLGTCSVTDNRAIRVEFSIQYSQEFRTKYFLGYLKRDGSLVGTVGWSEDSAAHQYRFILKRTPAEIMCQRPSPLEFRANKVQALWTFACKAVRFQVRKRLWSLSYFEERRETRNKLIEFDIRNYTSYGRPLVTEEVTEWTRRRGAITALDARFCREIRDYRLKVIPSHLSNVCVACGYQIRGTRVVCIDCQPQDGDYTNTVDICDDLRCRETAAQGGNHLPSHDFFKARTVVHVRDMHAINEDVKEALQRAQRVLCDHDIVDTDESICNGEQSFGTSEEVDVLSAVVNLTPKPTSSRLLRDSRVLPSRLLPFCQVCGLRVQQPCWFCVDCYTNSQDAFLCDKCESETLLRCARCTKPYKQPTWYYGLRAGDNFLCNTCTVQNHPAPDLTVARHTYLHILVRCKGSQEEPGAEVVDFLASHIETTSSPLGREVAMLRQQVQDQSDRMRNFERSFTRLEELMSVIAGRLCPQSPTGDSQSSCT